MYIYIYTWSDIWSDCGMTSAHNSEADGPLGTTWLRACHKLFFFFFFMAMGKTPQNGWFLLGKKKNHENIVQTSDEIENIWMVDRENPIVRNG